MKTNGKDNPDAHCQPIGLVQLHMHTHPYPRRFRLRKWWSFCMRKMAFSGRFLRMGGNCRMIRYRGSIVTQAGSGWEIRWWWRRLD